VAGVTGVEVAGREGGLELFTLETAPNTDPRLELYRLATEKNWPLAELHLEGSTLEDIFRQLTIGEEAAGAAIETEGGAA